jgi:hypothetical protein
MDSEFASLLCTGNFVTIVLGVWSLEYSLELLLTDESAQRILFIRESKY